MEIELYSVLSIIILSATAITVLFAFCSYVAFRKRQRASLNRTPAVPVREAAHAAKALPEPEFFRPYAPKRLR